MPTPRSNETRNQFMERCIPILINEGNEQDQAVAVCSSLWDSRNKLDKKFIEDVKERKMKKVSFNQLIYK